mgnify:FL=1|tara:strand:+ start:957 stop:1406 length:450 start_codon:yes stop_codon:yes gene_type:complete
MSIGKQFRNFFGGIGKRINRGLNKFGKDARRGLGVAGRFIAKNALPTLERLGKEAYRTAKMALPVISAIAPQIGVPLGLAIKGVELASGGVGDIRRGAKQVELLADNIGKGNLRGALRRGRQVKATGQELVRKVGRGQELAGQFESSMG